MIFGIEAKHRTYANWSKVQYEKHVFALTARHQTAENNVVIHLKDERWKKYMARGGALLLAKPFTAGIHDKACNFLGALVVLDGRFWNVKKFKNHTPVLTHISRPFDWVTACPLARFR